MKTIPIFLFVLSWGTTPLFAQVSSSNAKIDAASLYQLHCASCHGVNMEGAQSSPLRKENWLYASDRGKMIRTIKYGINNTDMIAWSKVLSERQTDALSDYIIASQDALPDEYNPLPEYVQTKDYRIKVETLVGEGFGTSPWGVEFVDTRRALITERRGGLRWMVDGNLDPQPIEGIPETTQYGDSGMMDLALDPDYSQNGWVYMGYVHSLGNGASKKSPAMTRIVRGRVSGHRWVDQEDVFRLPDSLHFTEGKRWGCRLMFDREGYLYFTIGDIGRNDDVQQLSRPGGKTYRIFPDGSIPPDNPFVNHSGAIKAIFSIGNRNVQGLGQHPVTGKLWATEHGPMGGDELNILEKGKNYGWPVITYGIDYSGAIVSNLTHKEGMEQPVKYWTPSPALCPLEFYTGDLFPKWKNQALVGALAFQEIKLLNLEDSEVVSEEVFFKNYGRVRDIKTGPEGAIYLLLNNPDSVVRLTPAESTAVSSDGVIR